MRRLVQISFTICTLVVCRAAAPQPLTENADNPITVEQIRLTTATRERLGMGRVLYLALRADGSLGSGTEADPYDASTPAKFDALMAGFHKLFATEPLKIILGPGKFQTNARDEYGDSAGRGFGAQHWLHANWTLTGTGMDLTEIVNVNPNTNGVTMFNSSGGTWGGKEEGNITITELTLCPSKRMFADTATSADIPIAGDGVIATGTKPGHGWTVGTQIRISKSPDKVFDGVYSLSSVTADTFSFDTPSIGRARGTVQRTGQWTAVRLNGGNLKLLHVRARDCGSSAPERECWPLWLGSGERNVIDGCVVEACSGQMSAIAIFPGTHPVIRNCRVDATGCESCLAISGGAGLIVNNQVKNANYAIYGDTFANDEGTVIHGNIFEDSREGGIYIRPIDHHRTVIITDNIVKGGIGSLGIGVEPLTNRQTVRDGWLNKRGEKIWIDDVTVANNSLGDKQLVLGQVRGGKVADNTAGSGAFRFMADQPVFCRGNRTPSGAIAMGLSDSQPNELSPKKRSSPSGRR